MNDDDGQRAGEKSGLYPLRTGTVFLEKAENWKSCVSVCVCVQESDGM